MTLEKATEIITIFKNEANLYSTLDLKEALTMALVCMTFVDAIIEKWHWLIGKGQFVQP